MVVIVVVMVVGGWWLGGKAEIMCIMLAGKEERMLDANKENVKNEESYGGSKLMVREREEMKRKREVEGGRKILRRGSDAPCRPPRSPG